MFLLLDTANVDTDMSLARHVTFVHKHNGVTQSRGSGSAAAGNGDAMQDDSDDSSDDENDQNITGNRAGLDEAGDKPIDPEVMREYIARARQHHPSVPKDVAPYVVEAYVTLRIQDGEKKRGTGASGRGNFGNGVYNNAQSANEEQTKMTARQLLSILRLSQSLARLRFSDYVAREDVDEAIRLTHASKASLMDEEVADGKARSEDVVSRIYGLIRDYRRSVGEDRVEKSVCESMATMKGFTSEQFQTTLEEYQALNILQVNATDTHIIFVN